MAIVNALLSQGRLLESQKHSLILPHLKKLGLDSTIAATYTCMQMTRKYT